MRLEEAAKELGLSTKHILRFVKSGELEAQKVEVTVTARRVKRYPKKALVWDISQDAIERLKAKRREYYDTQPDWIKGKARL
jgi:predicted site-specific integrase-resolvase